MATIPDQHVTLAEFLQNEERYIQDTMNKLGRKYVQRAESLLQQVPFCYKPSMATQVANGIIFKGQVVHTNAEADDGEDESKGINNIGSEFSQILNLTLLLIQAPVKYKRSLEIDAKARDLQYKNFIKLYPFLNQENKKVHIEDTKVYSYDQMKKEILDFMEKHASRAVTALVFFNGHGNENGMCFDEHKVGAEVKLDTVIQDLQDTVKANRSALKSQSKDELPSKVELIFGQCFAHLYSPIKSPDFEVHHFTSEDMKYTLIIETPDGEDVADSRHLQLEDHNPVSEQNWVEADQLRERLSTGKKKNPEVDVVTAVDEFADSMAGLKIQE